MRQTDLKDLPHSEYGSYSRVQFHVPALQVRLEADRSDREGLRKRASANARYNRLPDDRSKSTGRCLAGYGHQITGTDIPKGCSRHKDPTGPVLNEQLRSCRRHKRDDARKVDGMPNSCLRPWQVQDVSGGRKQSREDIRLRIGSTQGCNKEQYGNPRHLIGLSVGAKRC